MSSDHPWFAVHDEVINDNKLVRIKRATRQPRLMVIGAWTTLLALSNQSPVRGVLLIREERPLTTQEIFDEWDMDGGEGQALLDAFADQGLVCREGDAWVICNWEKRQPKQDKSTERVRRWRERNAAANGQADETNVTFRNGYNETLRDGTEIEREIEYIEREKGGESEGDDLYSFERKLGAIVGEGTDPNAGTGTGTRPRDPDDETVNAIWGCLLKLCDGDIDQAGAVAVVTNELAEKLEWLKPFPRGERDRETALNDWWRPIKQALKVRGWDKETTGQAMVAAAQAMYRRQLSPGKPSALTGELAKQKATRGRASPVAQAAVNGNGGSEAKGVDAIRERIAQKQRGAHGRNNGGG